MLYKKISAILVFSSFVVNGFSQQASTDKYKLSLAPSSPEAAMLFKFSEIPVSKYTGVPSISIPIKKLKTSDDFSLDISLDYHASGNRVNEIPSYVGLGWNLNSGGMISRKVRGLPDDADIGQGFLKLRQNHTFADLVVASPTNYPNLVSGCWDAEPDEFFFNVNGYSGSFAFDWSTSINIKVNSKFPVRVVLFQEIPNSNAITKWQITMPDGYLYSFSSLEQSQNKSAYTGLGTCHITGMYTTSWYLTQIVNLNNSNEYIDFTYESYSLDYDWIFIESKTFGNGSCGCPEISGGNVGNTPNRTLVNGLRISKINLYPSDIQVDFISTNDRQDLNSTYDIYNRNNKTLDAIQFTYNGEDVVDEYSLSYFYQGNRLMLKSIQNLGAGGITDNPFEFTYNTFQLPERNSKSVDAWGYYNGKPNSTLLPSFVNRLASYTYFFNGADRSPDYNFGKAQMLEKIKYPTGGRTELVYEGHKYAYIQNQTVASLGQYAIVDKNEFSESIGNGPNNTWKTTTIEFQIGTLQDGAPPVEIFIKSVANSCITEGDGSFFCFGGRYLPRASIYKFSTITNQYEQIFAYLQTPAANGTVMYSNPHVDFKAGNYRIVTEAYHLGTNSPNVYDFINVSVKWKEIDHSRMLLQKEAGGLRIKEIKNFDNVSTFPKVIKYTYNSSSNNISSGVINGEPIYSDGGHILTNCGATNIKCTFISLVGSGNIILGETNGSHIGYREVTSFETGNGKVISKFNSPFEFQDVINFRKPFGYPSSFSYRTGLPSEEAVYNESGSLLKRDLFEYDYSQTEINSLKVSKGDIICNYSLGVGSGDPVTECSWNQNSYWDYYAAWAEPLRMGFAQLKKQSTFQDRLWVEKNYIYDNKLQFLKQESYKNKDANSGIITNIYKYPGDEDQMSGLTTDQLNAIMALKNQNRVSIKLEESIQKDENYVSRTRYNYGTFAAGQVNLESLDLSIGNRDLEQRFKINKYDKKSNILEQYKADDIFYSYLWDYNFNYLIAETANASQSDIAYTSFEADSKGSWVFNGIPSVTGGGITGKQSYSLNSGLISRSGLTKASNYTISYWSKLGSVSISGGIQSNGFTGKMIDGWTYHEVKVTSTTNVSIFGSGYIDELRMYPVQAQMKTYTYEPLIGLLSECDENNRITNYEYDSFRRLSLVRDEDNNILKKICYNYAGQPEDCDCANVLANWQNTVTTLRCKKDINNKNTGEQEQEQKDMNSCSSTFNQIRWIVTGTKLAACPIAVTCNSGNCSGDSKKCLNNICERGIKVYTDTYQSGGHWVCVYHYEWSDGSWSQNFTQISSLPCVILNTI